MKLLLLLAFVAFLVTTNAEERFGKSEKFLKAVQESLSTEYNVWLRNHQAAKSGNPIEPGIKFLAHHNIPNDIPLIPPGETVAVNQFGVKCDDGYTGDFCNIPVCPQMANITSHYADTIGEAIELGTSYECNDAITFPVDNYCLDIVVTISSLDGGMPSANLTLPNGTVIVPDEISNTGTSIRYFQAWYYALAEYTGAGYYTLQLASETIAPCSYQITTQTRAVYDTGFVQQVNDDNIQRDIYAPWRVLKEPIQNTANYLGAKLSGVLQPAKPEIVTFYNGDDKQYAPMTLGIRYQCNAPYVSPAYTCVRTDFYKAKFAGYDHRGNVFQRLYTFTCGETDPTGSPPTDTPTQQPDVCFNGGTMITYGQNNRTCICGQYYTGNQCQIKLCFNNGQLIDGVCLCQEGFSGPHCTDIYCRSQAQENFDTRRRALVFVVRTTPSFSPYINSSVAKVANQIIGYTDINNAGYFRRYVLIGYANDALTYVGEFDDSIDFRNALATLPISSTTNNCSDSLYAALSAAVTSESVRLFQKSPIFTFGDNLPSDPQNRAALYESLGTYQGQIFTFLTDASQATCNIDTHNPEYRELRRLAQFTHGLVPYLPVNNLTDTAFNIARGVEAMSSLATNDFVDQCSLGSKYTTFFVDDSTGKVTVLATGDSLTITVMSTDGTTLTPDSSHNIGNTHAYSFTTLKKGNYLLQISADQNGPCQFRVFGDSGYDMFVGYADALTTDLSRKQPRPFQVTNIVARLNGLNFRNPSEVFAEVVVWTNDRTTGMRHVLYAANGDYRDACDYHFLFEKFVCTQRDLQFYISLYVTDRVGYTVQRVRAGICVVPNEIPPDPNGCQNGGVMDPTLSNSTCICPNGWTGDKCQTIQCQNGGTNKFSFCECRAGFTGQFCEIISCTAETFEDFSPNRRSLTFVVHDSTTTIQMVQKMQSQMAQIIQDITQQHARWINQYNLITFDNGTVVQPIETSDPGTFLQAFSTFAQQNSAQTKRSCDNLALLEALYIHLSTSDAEKYGLYYVFMNGIMNLSNMGLFDSVQVLLETTQSQVNIVQTNSFPCGQPITAEGPSRMWMLTSLTGGQVYVISSATTEKVMKTIPFQYRNSLTYEKYYDDCSSGQNFYFPVDSESQTVNILIDGELKGDPLYIHPDGTNDTMMVTNIFNDYSANTRLDQIIGQCDDNWRQVEGRCYRFYAQLSTWDQAKTACGNQKAILATIYDQGVETYLTYNAGQNTFWIGLNDRNQSGTFVWDQGDNPALPLSFTNWGSGEPSTAGQCVSDSRDNKWKVTDCNTQLAFACVKHIYDADYAPDQSSSNKIDPGYWNVKVTTYSGACAVQITAQSAIQVYPEYTRNIHDDFGYPSPLSGNLSNYIIAHATGISSFGGDNAGSLQYAHMYSSNKDQTMIQVEKLYPRDLQMCKHQFVSDAFTCPSLLFQTMFTGVDRYGYAFQRIKPTLCYNEANMTCANGGVFYDNKCICPPNWGGEYCNFPFCANGHLAPNYNSCDCEGNLFEGQFCEIPRCVNGTSNLPPDTNQNKTFILILDGSFTGGMEAVYQNLQATLTDVLTKANNVAPGWFVNYIGVVAFDSGYTKPTSTRIEETTINNFVTNIIAAATSENYKSASSSRALFTALSIALASKNIYHRSQAYIISAANAEDRQLLNPSLDLIAYTHTAINTIFIGDQAAPGNSSYGDPKVDALHELTVLSGGGFYQVAQDKLGEMWWTQLATIFNSYGIVFNSYHNCNSHTSYIQLDGNTNKLILDIFSMVSVSLSIFDSNGTPIALSSPYRTATNYLYSLSGSNGNTFVAGVYQISITSLNVNNHPFCTVNVKGISTQSTYVAYTQDTGMANGQHSNFANYYPKALPDINAAVVKSDVPLQFAQAYNVTGGIIWASPLIQRSNCNYNFITKDVFRCPDATYGFAIDGTDNDGHPFRRFEIVHCLGQTHAVTLEDQPHSLVTLIKKD